MSNIVSVYVKDYRKKVDIDKTLVKRYDSKYYYLDYKQEDSKFNETIRHTYIDDLDIVINKDLQINSVADFAAEFEISSVQAIALLIDQHFAFNEATEVWSYRPQRIELSGGKYVVTAAQSNTKAHPFLRTLIAYCKSTDSELIILPIYYGVNPDEDVIWWDEDVSPYLCFKLLELGSTVKVLGDLSNTATAVNPLSGLKAIAKGKTTIIGSTTLMKENIAVAPTLRPMTLWATGCVTNENYRRRKKTGYKADFHHTHSAVRIEIRDNVHHIRTLCGNSGNGDLIDLGVKYTKQGKQNSVSFDATWGDLHVGQTCNLTRAAGIELMMSMGLPDHLILHDVFDGEQVNPHEVHNPFAKFNHIYGDLNQELDMNYLELLDLSELANKQVIVVNSNHDDFLNRWLVRTDWRKLDNRKTAQTYLNAALLASKGELGSFFQYEMVNRGLAPEKVRFLKESEDFQTSGIQHGYHGDKGASGSRGSIKSFAPLGKSNIGHSHSSGIYNGCWQNGTFTKLILGYMKGLNRCDNTLIFTYQDGKRQMIEFYNGEY